LILLRSILWTLPIVSMFCNHNISRDGSLLETLWLQNTETMDKVQRIDHSNTAPSSKTFRDESYWFCFGECFHSVLLPKCLCHRQIKLSFSLEYLLEDDLCIIRIVSDQELNPEAHHVLFLLRLKHFFLFQVCIYIEIYFHKLVPMCYIWLELRVCCTSNSIWIQFGKYDSMIYNIICFS
jgi:hypothetical protein